MQLTVISLPSGEHLASLSYPLEADEILIGQSEACQVRLADPQNLMAERQALLTKEGDEYYLQNLASTPLNLNGTLLTAKSCQPALLTDGDIIACGDYQMAFSNFTPWKSNLEHTSPLQSTQEESQTKSDTALNEQSNNCDQNEFIYDPFEELPVIENAQIIEKEKIPISGQLLHNDSDLEASLLADFQLGSDDVQLIDLLDDQTIESNIHRELWLEDPTHTNENSLFLMQGEYTPSMASHGETESSTTSLPIVISYQQNDKASIYMILQALDRTLNDIAPLNYQTSNKRTAPNKATKPHFKQRFHSILQHCHRLWSYKRVSSRYQQYFQSILDSKRHRMLFIHHFRETMKKQA